MQKFLKEAHIATVHVVHLHKSLFYIAYHTQSFYVHI